MTSFKTVRVEHGPGGWGGPLTITPTEERNVIACITGGGIHPVAQTIAELTGAPVVDAFKNPVPPEKMACVVIDCGGTARCGVYPRLGVLTVDVTPTFPSGPLMQYIRTDNFVSGVTPQNVFVLEGPAVGAAPAAAPAAGGSGHEAAGAAGGWAAAVQAAAGTDEPVPVYVADRVRGAGRLRRLEEALQVEVRTRLLNPAWYEAMLR
ncbi:MAG: cobaltochelatase subunit CobN, partial [Limnochordales bacterium]